MTCQASRTRIDSGRRFAIFRRMRRAATWHLGLAGILTMWGCQLLPERLAVAVVSEAICPHNPETLADVARSVDEEQAVTLADVLLRRLPVGWSACHALDGAERVAQLMAQRLGWPEDRIPQEVEAYRRELGETLVPVDAITE